MTGPPQLDSGRIVPAGGWQYAHLTAETTGESPHDCALFARCRIAGFVARAAGDRRATRQTGHESPSPGRFDRRSSPRACGGVRLRRPQRPAVGDADEGCRLVRQARHSPAAAADAYRYSAACGRGAWGRSSGASMCRRKRPKTGRALATTLEQIELVQEMIRRYPDTFEQARTAADVVRIQKSGKIASLIGVEGGHSIEDSIENLRRLHKLGAGYMTLTHSDTLAWADAATDKGKSGGLSPFGEEVVREMNRLGMLVDLSHVSDETMKDALRISQGPDHLLAQFRPRHRRPSAQRAGRHPAAGESQRRRGDGQFLPRLHRARIGCDPGQDVRQEPRTAGQVPQRGGLPARAEAVGSAEPVSAPARSTTSSIISSTSPKSPASITSASAATTTGS